MFLELDFDALHARVQEHESNLLDGRVLKHALLEQLGRATAILAERGITPKLAVIQVGDDPASSIYVRNKMRACARIGIDSLEHRFPADTSAQTLHACLHALNQDESVHGVLLQLPLPAHLDPSQAILLIDPDKDVDGYHPDNLGRLMAWRGTLEPCTPRGIMTLLHAYRVPLQGTRAVVVGRSMTVGRPMAQMLMRANATVTTCHRHTRALHEHIAAAQLVVVAVGVPELIKGEWLAPGSVVVDVGITRLEDGSLSGDVEFEAARQRASLITPVPGGVGQLTVATLMENTVRVACKANHIHIDLAALGN